MDKPQTTAAADSRRPRPRGGPLAGVRIADFTWVAAGPLGTRFLADMGAEVIKIEDASPGHVRIDHIRRVPITRGGKPMPGGHEVAGFDIDASGFYNNYNRSKLAVTIDMTKPEGRELCERLITQCNVVVENFAPGVMERWGLTPERLNELSPEIIFARMSGFGHEGGPYEMYRSYGPVVQAIAGLSQISGLPGGMPSGWGMSYMDNQAGYQATNGILAAIYHRNATGKGGVVDLSSVEAGVSLLGPKILDVTVNDAVHRGDRLPCGNDLPDQAVAPHGVYPANREDEWIAIAVMDDQQWENLKAAMGEPAWAAGPSLATGEGRHAARREIDRHLGEWTKGHDKHELGHRLQAAGVPAMAVQSEADKEVDPQLEHRGLYFKLDHPACGPSRFEGVPVKFSRTGRPIWRSAPLVGEDNDYVFKGIVGLSDEEYDTLRQSGVI